MFHAFATRSNVASSDQEAIEAAPKQRSFREDLHHALTGIPFRIVSGPSVDVQKTGPGGKWLLMASPVPNAPILDEPVLDIAHLGHVELLTPIPEASLAFFVDVMGMTESGRQGASVYLRGWDDYERYSLKLTGSTTSGLGHAAFRARSPRALARRVAALEASGQAVGWHEGELGTARRSSSATPPPEIQVTSVFTASTARTCRDIASAQDLVRLLASEEAEPVMRRKSKPSASAYQTLTR